MNLLVILAVFTPLCVNVVISRRSSRRYLDKHLDSSRGMCRSGDGSNYRGYESRSARGNICLKWYRFENVLTGASKGLGYHNNCRNPNQSLMPWCYVKRGKKIVREFCNIPKCPIQTASPLTEADTEMTCGQRSEWRMNKIVGGSFTSIESQPWVAAIYRRGKFRCGGSLIAPCWVLTAAHCLENVQHLSKLSVYLGKNAINETDAEREQRFYVEKMTLHHKYNKTLYDYNNDIALLKISDKNGRCAVKSASVRTVCLPPSKTQLPAGYQCSVAGFGRENTWDGHFSQYLKQAELNLISQNDCRSKSDYHLTDNMICARSPDWTRDACKGDSGGPLVCDVSGRMFLFGVVSWGEGCAEKNKPGVYAQVSNYNKWIGAETGLPQYTAGKMYPDKA